MKILFLTTARFENIESKGIYTDLLRKFRDEGNEVTIVCPNERRYSNKSKIIEENGVKILYVWTTNLQKTNLFEKNITTLLIEYFYFFAIKKYLNYLEYDLIIYSTPPITFANLIKKIKFASKAKTYLLLKDIFPQNAVDLNIIKKGGLIHKYYSYIEKKLYKISDIIGCMSEANQIYILKHNTFLLKNRVEINPNSIDLAWLNDNKLDSIEFKKKWGISPNSLICIYGGNLGRPQGLNFLLDILTYYKNDKRIYFFIIGDGTEFNKIKSYFDSFQPINAFLQKELPKKDFDDLVKYGNAGLILLDKRFTIPNFPSRLLTYMENKMSIWAATDINTDIRNVIKDNNLGFWVENGDLPNLIKEIDFEIDNFNLNKERGENSYNFLKNNYSTERSFQSIIKWFK